MQSTVCIACCTVHTSSLHALLIYLKYLFYISCLQVVSDEVLVDQEYEDDFEVK